LKINIEETFPHATQASRNKVKLNKEVEKDTLASNQIRNNKIYIKQLTGCKARERNREVKEEFHLLDYFLFKKFL
jgi:hypothetical protein